MNAPATARPAASSERLRDELYVDALAGIQRLVAAQADLASVHQAIVDGALALVGAQAAALRLVDRADSSWMIAVAARGTAGAGARRRSRSPITEGVSGHVITTGQVVVTSSGDSMVTTSRLAPPGTQAVIGCPLTEHGKVIGCLVVGTRDPDRTWSEPERRLLSQYTDNAAVALSVARAGHEAHEAVRDPLTGLGNRTLLLDRLEHELARADRSERNVSLLFLDLDGFKLINDSLGHLVGDRLLVAVAGRIAACTRRGDHAVRLGGDEFAILLREGSAPEAVAQRVISAIHAPFDIDGHEVFVDVSVGIAQGRQEPETLLRNADVAMYQAKRTGNGRYMVFEPRMHAERLDRLDLDTQLRHAIKRGEFELHYQPLIDLRSGTIAALEGLIRWNHPRRGLVSPIDFIPLAEETGLITDLDHWVIEEACRQYAEWRLVPPTAVTVNLSVRDLLAGGLVDVVQRAIGGRFPASALILELTESQPLQGSLQVLRELRTLRELGCRIALDDFGTGYASLLSLAQIPVDILKIAKPFVDLPPDRARGLLAGMVDVGRHMGLTIVAEGIETPAQRDVLVELGCELGQGYLLGRPVAAAAAGTMFDAWGLRRPAAAA